MFKNLCDELQETATVAVSNYFIRGNGITAEMGNNANKKPNEIMLFVHYLNLILLLLWYSLC